MVDTKGNAFNDIDQTRVVAIKDIKNIINEFLTGNTSLYEFKTSLDSYNKQNNYWGFTAAKGQMFFNLLAKSSEADIKSLVQLLKNIITEPINLQDGLNKMKQLFEYASAYLQKSPDRRKVANPMSSAYFLSYFWQIHDHYKWPIMYSSIIVSFQKLGIWKDHDTSYGNYEYFYHMNEEAKAVLKEHTGHPISNWDLEHALWNFSGTATVNSKQQKPKTQRAFGRSEPEIPETKIQEPKILNPGFELQDYIIPRVA